jgi:Ca2+-binding RTX toxin-like protein
MPATPLPASVLDALALSHSLLARFAERPDAGAVLTDLLGPDLDHAGALAELRAWRAAEFDALPEPRLVEDAVLAGARGAYSALRHQALLACGWATSPGRSPAEITEVLLEEFGHALDSRLNRRETAGDEGALFAAAVTGRCLSPTEIARIRAEDDWTEIKLDGVRERVECSGTTVTTQQVLDLRAGIDQALTQIEQAMALRVLAERLPVVGDELKAAFDAGASAIRQIRDLEQKLVQVLNFAADPAGHTLQQVQNAINTAIQGAGFGGAAAVTLTGADLKVTFAAGKSNQVLANQSLDADLGFPGLSLQTAGKATATFGYDLNLTFGVDAGGFYVGTSAPEEIKLDLDLDVTGFTADARLGFLNFDAVDAGSAFSGEFSVSLSDADGKLRLSELGNDFLSASLTGQALLGLKLSADMGDAALPKISADLVASWNFAATALNGTAANGAAFGARPTIEFQNVRYDFGSFIQDYVVPLLDQLQPILEPINKVLAVFRTDLDFLKLIPNWQSLIDKAGADDGSGGDKGDGRITLLDFIELAKPELDMVAASRFIDLVDKVLDWVEFFTSRSFGPDEYHLGSFSILADIRDAAFQLGSVVPQIGAGAEDLAAFLNGLTGTAASGTVNGQNGKQILQEMFLTSSAFSFPIIENPIEAFKLLLGGNADLFSLDLPKLELAFGPGFNASGNPTGALVDIVKVPVLPLVDLAFRGGASISFDLDFGYDTRGLKQYAAGSFANPLLALNGLYLSDNLVNGQDLPEITLAAMIEIGIAAGIWPVEIGGGGNIGGQIFLDLRDGLGGMPGDGKVYLDQMAAALASNPFSIFDTSGRLTAGLSGYVRVGGFDIWRDHTPRFTIGSFSFSDNPGGSGSTPPPPPQLAAADGSVLRLNIGDRAGLRATTDKADGDETFEIGAGSSGFTVLAFGRQQAFAGVSLLTGDGGLGSDAIQLGKDVNLSASLMGGFGDDALWGGAGGDTLEGGAGNDDHRGRGGDDRMWGGTGDDYFEGGAGADSIDGGTEVLGNGFDLASYRSSTAVRVNLTLGRGFGGEAEGDTLAGIEAVEGSDDEAAGDTLQGSVAAEVFYGRKGNDLLQGFGGNDFLLGGPGADTLDGGTGYDAVSYIQAAPGSGIHLNLMTGFAAGEAAGDSLVGIEQIEGSNNGDTLIGGTGNHVFFGNGGQDSLNGGDGADYLEGGAGADTLDGGAGFDTASYYNAQSGIRIDFPFNVPGGVQLFGVGQLGDAASDRLHGIERIVGSNAGGDTLNGSERGEELDGAGGDDSIRGGDGDDTLFGGAGADDVGGSPGDDLVVGGEGADTLRGDGGIDTVDYSYSANGVQGAIDTGTGQGLVLGGPDDGDILFDFENIIGSNAAGSGDKLAGGGAANLMSGLGGSDTLSGEGGADTLLGGTGNDILLGEGEDDLVEGDDGADTLDGATGADTLRGGAGNDAVLAGEGDDSLEGGTGADTLDGDEGFDTATYAAATAAVFVNLSGASVTVAGATAGPATARDAGGFLDTIVGVERVIGSAFNDTLVAHHLGATLLGAVGNDHLLGGEGIDSLEGGAGLDSLSGLAGADLLQGGAGADSLSGGLAFDYAVFTGDAAGVVLNLGAAATIGGVALAAERARDGSAAIDSLTGIEGAIGSLYADSLVGSDAANVLAGLDGNDALDGRGGKDTMAGGAGNDTYFVDSAADLVVESYLPLLVVGSGVDRIVATLDYSLEALGDLEQLELRGAARRGTGNGGANTIFGTTGADTLDGKGGSDDLRGGGGNDIYLFDSTGDRVVETAGGGRDEIRIATTDFFVPGPNNSQPTYTFSLAESWAAQVEDAVLLDNARAVHLVGNTLGNRLVSNDHGSSLLGSDGADELVTGRGRDLVDGGTGSDLLVVDWSAAEHEVGTRVLEADSVGGYQGWMGHRVSEHGTYLRADFRSIERFQLTGGIYLDDLTTGDGADTLLGLGGDDTLRSGKGADSIDGGAGTDRWSADKSSATLGMRIDLTSVVASTYTIDGRQAAAAGIEVLGGEGAEDVFRSGSGADTITTRQDFLHDRISTNAGNDVVRVAGGRDVVHMGAGSDLLKVDWGLAEHEVGTRAFEADALGGYQGWMGHRTSEHGSYLRLDFSGVERFELTGGAYTDYLQSGTGADTVVGRSGDDTIQSGSGADSIDGGSNAVPGGTVRGADRWAADKSAATLGMAIDLISDLASTYTIGGQEAAVVNVERLGGDDRGDLFQSGSGADTLTTRYEFFHDHVSTNAGDDIVLVNGGRDVVQMGAGSDLLAVDWSASDHEVGTRIFEVDAAGGYSGWMGHRVSEHGSYHRLDFGSVERFRITGGAYSDYFVSGDAADTLSGLGGNDTIRSGTGADSIAGGSGVDRWLADKSAATSDMAIDLLNDVVSAFTIGGQGAAASGIEMLGGDDRGELFLAGAGADTITTRYEHWHDYVSTGLGDDVVQVGGGRDIAEMGGGFDLLILDWSQSAHEIGTRAFTSLVAAGTYEGWYGHISSEHGDYKRLDFSGVERFRLTGGVYGDHLLSGNAADTISGLAGDDTIRSGAGADSIEGGLGFDRWQADKSAATAAINIDLGAGGPFAYQIAGQEAAVGSVEVLGIGDADGDRFATGSGADLIRTRQDFAHDFIETNGGNDTVLVAGGRDVVDLGGGADLLVVDWTASAHEIGTRALSGTLAAGYAGWLGHASSEHGSYLRVDFRGVERFQVTGGAYGDYVATGDGADTVRGLAGADFFRTGAGADSIDGGSDIVSDAVLRGMDRWQANLAAATLGMSIDLLSHAASGFVIGGRNGAVTNVEVLGGSDAAGDRFASGSGADTITTRGDFQHDFLETNGGDDIVRVAGGRDVVLMGAGSDLLVVDWSTSAHEIGTRALGGSLAAGYGGWMGHISSEHGSYLRVDFDGVERFRLTGGAYGDYLATGDGADTISGLGGDDFVRSGAGADSVDGGAGIDRWSGDKSAATAGFRIDLLASGGGNYVIGGQAGAVASMEMLGGSDAAGDRFASGSGADTITTRYDFQHDFVETNGGDDIVQVGGGRDVVLMGAGSDLLAVDWAAWDTSMATRALGGSLALGYAGWIGHESSDHGSYYRVDFSGVERFLIRGGKAGDGLVTGDGADTLLGLAGNDVITAGGGSDSIDGGEGFDAAIFALARFDYSVDTIAGGGLVVTDMSPGSPGGADTLFGVEELRFADGTFAAAALFRAATDGDDAIPGTGRADTIGGLGGADRLAGYGGDDSLSGGAGNDSLLGGEGRDRLDGGTGADSLSGGAGNDTYVVDDAGDAVSEAGGSGIDLVESSIAFTLGSGMENLILTGTASVAGVGNALANVITGNEGANSITGGDGADTLSGGLGADTLVGGAGADSLFGGSGNDVFALDSTSDTVRGGAGESGVDTVRAGFAYTLGTGLEYLTMLGSADIAGTGNEAANRIDGNGGANLLLGFGGKDTLIGNAGADTLDGGALADILQGGTGADVYRYGPLAEVVNEVIQGFEVGIDDIALSAAGFGGGLTAGMSLAGGRFVANTTGRATAPAGTSQFIFETDAKRLWWDDDGLGGDAAVVVVTLKASTTTGFSAADLIIVA